MRSSPTRSANAYEKLVERLLASPHYGERWGRHWLDAARYADSDGYEKDKSRQVWVYRDWVINAFNRDLPYDQFIIEQIAGDLLPNATQDQIVATGFLRNVDAQRGGRRRPRAVPHGRDVRPDGRASARAFLGLTIQCAQCHDHKFDPLTQEEYYRLFAFLNNDHEAQRVVYTPAEQMKVAELRRQMREIEDELQQPHAGLGGAAWRSGRSKRRADQPKWTTRRGRERRRQRRSGTFRRRTARSSAQGYAPTKFSTLDARHEPGEDHHRVPPRAADRPEPAVRRAGPVVHGDLRPERVRGRGRPPTDQASGRR